MDAKSQTTTFVPLEEQQGADAWIQEFSYQQTRSGATKWVVMADQAKVFTDDHMVKLEAVTVQLFDQDFQQEQMRITAEFGVMNTDNNDFDLMSHDEKTVMTFETGYQVLSNRLTWKETSQQIRTDDPVIIQGNGLLITGTGLIGDVQKDEFQLLHNVRAEVSSP